MEKTLPFVGVFPIVPLFFLFFPFFVAPPMGIPNGSYPTMQPPVQIRGIICPSTDERIHFHPQLYHCFAAQRWHDKVPGLYYNILYVYMSCGPYLVHNAVDGVFLPRSRGVPTSFYKLNMIFLTNRGTSEYYFPYTSYTQIRAVAHIYIYMIYIYTIIMYNFLMWFLYVNAVLLVAYENTGMNSSLLTLLFRASNCTRSWLLSTLAADHLPFYAPTLQLHE